MKIVLFKLFNVDTKKDILERTYTTLDEFSKGRAIDEPGLDTKTASQYWRDYNALLNKLDRYISQTDVSKYLCVMESDSCEIVSKTEEKIKDLKDKSKLLGNNFNSSFVSS